MCLYIDKEKTEKFLEENKDKEFVYCYKVVRVNTLYGTCSNIPLVESPYFNYAWKPGKHESESMIKYFDVNISPANVVTKSFHFLTTEEDAVKYKKLEFSNPVNYKIVKFKCFIDSFVAAGCTTQLNNLTSLTFRKVELSQEEYDKCFIT